MSEKLKIYACSGIGVTTPKVKFNTNGNTVSNTQAVNTLLVKMNSKLIEAKRLRGLSKEEKIAALNDADFFYVAAELAKKYKNDEAMLLRAGYVMATLSEAGMFDCNTLNETEREEHLKAAMQEALWAMDDDNGYHNDPEWMAWWQLNVMDRNKTGLNFGQQQIVRKILRDELAAMQKNINDFSDAVKGVGEVDTAWMENEDISEYLLHGSEYFLYTYLSDDQIYHLPSVFKDKKAKQMRTYNYCKSFFVDVYGSEEEMQEIIRAGIIDTCGETPEQIAAGIVTGKAPEGIGQVEAFSFLGLVGKEAVEALIAIIAAVASIVTAIITSICSMVAQTNIAKYGALDKKVVDSSVPDADDWEGISLGGGTINLGSGSGILTIALIGLGAFLLLRK